MQPSNVDQPSDAFKRRFSDAGLIRPSVGAELLLGMRRSSLTNAARAVATSAAPPLLATKTGIVSQTVANDGDEDEERQAQELAEAITEMQQYSLSSNHIRASLRQSLVANQHRRRSSVLNSIPDCGSVVSSSHASGSVVAGKRRSRVDMASAVAEVLQFYNELQTDSDEEDGAANAQSNNTHESLNHALQQDLDDDRPTKRHIGSFSTAITCANTSAGQERSSSFHSSTTQPVARRKSFTAYLDDSDLKHSQEISAKAPQRVTQREVVTDESFNMRKQSLRDSLILSSMAIPRLSTSSALTMSTAAAALAASAVAQSNDRRLSQQYQTIPATKHQHDRGIGRLNQQREMKRRVEFSISNIALEASIATASRMELLMKDRMASRTARLGQRFDPSPVINDNVVEKEEPQIDTADHSKNDIANPGRRRSLSFTSNIQVANDFSAAVTEEAHQNVGLTMSHGQDEVDHPSGTAELSRARRNRSLLSLPDANLLNRLSHATLEENIDLDFMDKEETSLNVPVNLVHVPDMVLPNLGHWNHESSNHADETNTNASLSDYESISDDDLGDAAADDFYPTLDGNFANPFNDGGFFSLQLDSVTPRHVNGSATEAFPSNAAHKNDCEYRTDDVYFGADPHEEIDAVPDMNEREEFSMSSFDGKSSHVVARYPQTDREQSISLVILKATASDDRFLKYLLQNNKDSTRLCLDSSNGEHGGEVALHVASRCGCLRAIHSILAADKESALIRNHLGNVALHNAVNIGNFAAVSALCGQNSFSARIQNEEGCLPLHDAVSTSAHHQDAPQITAVLLAAFPEAVCVTTDEGLLPIHLAAMSGFSAGLRTIMAHGFDTIYRKEMTEYMLPLDFAVDGLRSEVGESDDFEHVLSVVQQQNIQERTSSTNLKSNFTACVEILLMSSLHNSPVLAPRDDIFLPLHGTVISRPLLRTWKTIFDTYSPDHEADVDAHGQNPLHYFCSSRSFDDVLDTVLLQEVFARSPQWFEQRDKNGFLPLHLALLDSRCSFQFIETMFNCKPVTCNMEVARWSKTLLLRGLLPFQLAAISNCSVDVAYSLLRSDPMGVR